MFWRLIRRIVGTNRVKEEVQDLCKESERERIQAQELKQLALDRLQLLEDEADLVMRRARRRTT